MSLYCVRLTTIVFAAFRSCPSSPPEPLTLRTSPPLCLTPAPLSPLPPLSQSPPDSINSKKPSLPDSKHIDHRGPELVASQYIARPYSASFYVYPNLFKTRFLHCLCQWWILPPPPPCLIRCLAVIRHANLCWKMTRARSVRGVRTHISDPKKQHCLDDHLKIQSKYPRFFPSQPRILVIRVQLFRFFLRLLATAGQLLSPAVRTRPIYLNKMTVSRGSP